VLHNLFSCLCCTYFFALDEDEVFALPEADDLLLPEADEREDEAVDLAFVPVLFVLPDEDEAEDFFLPDAALTVLLDEFTTERLAEATDRLADEATDFFAPDFAAGFAFLVVPVLFPDFVPIPTASLITFFTELPVDFFFESRPTAFLISFTIFITMLFKFYNHNRSLHVQPRTYRYVIQFRIHCVPDRLCRVSEHPMLLPQDRLREPVLSGKSTGNADSRIRQQAQESGQDSWKPRISGLPEVPQGKLPKLLRFPR
jgi:hypothetical protein